MIFVGHSWKTRSADGVLAGHHRRIRDHDVSVICGMGGNAVRILSTSDSALNPLIPKCVVLLLTKYFKGAIMR
jgi:tRNA A22 N-methylase